MKVVFKDTGLDKVEKGDIAEFPKENGRNSYYIITYLEKEKKYYFASMRGSQRKIYLFDSIEDMFENKSGYKIYSGKSAELSLQPIE